MIEHKPWIGKKKNPLSLRIAVVGYSHHKHAEHKDDEDFTRVVVSNVLAGTQKRDSFFGSVPQYFGFMGDEKRKEFWESVTFFNFLPSVVGNSEDKHRKGTKEQVEKGRDRFLKIIEYDKPDAVFVFSTKAGRDLPLKLKEVRGLDCATFKCDGKAVRVFGFRHPQGAHKKTMTLMVNKALKSCHA